MLLMYYLLIMIPITAILDYFTFRKSFEEQFKTKMKWNHFFIPCLLEIGLFVFGYYLGVLYP